MWASKGKNDFVGFDKEDKIRRQKERQSRLTDAAKKLGYLQNNTVWTLSPLPPQSSTFIWTELENLAGCIKCFRFHVISHGRPFCTYCWRELKREEPIIIPERIKMYTDHDLAFQLGYLVLDDRKQMVSGGRVLLWDVYPERGFTYNEKMCEEERKLRGKCLRFPTLHVSDGSPFCNSCYECRDEWNGTRIASKVGLTLVLSDGNVVWRK